MMNNSITGLGPDVIRTAGFHLFSHSQLALVTAPIVVILLNVFWQLVLTFSGLEQP